jgi:hypothetical protein
MGNICCYLIFNSLPTAGFSTAAYQFKLSLILKFCQVSPGVAFIYIKKHLYHLKKIRLDNKMEAWLRKK